MGPKFEIKPALVWNHIHTRHATELVMGSDGEYLLNCLIAFAQAGTRSTTTESIPLPQHTKYMNEEQTTHNQLITIFPIQHMLPTYFQM